MIPRLSHKLPWAVQKVLHKVYPITSPIFNLDSVLVVLRLRRLAVSPDEWLFLFLTLEEKWNCHF